jgi:hypothetical protein
MQTNDRFSRIISDSQYKPEYIGLKWPQEQRLPDPHVEIEYHEFLLRLVAADYGMIGMSFSQLYLDWGKGPLMANPRFYYKSVGDHLLMGIPLEFPVDVFIRQYASFVPAGVCVSASEANVHPRIAWMKGEYKISADTIYVQKKYTGAGGWDGLDNHWNVHYYFFPHYALAAAERYQSRRYESDLMGKGNYFPAQWGDGVFKVRFFRLGCSHPNSREVYGKEARDLGFNPFDNFDHCYWCPDCGYKRMVNSSG